MAKRERWRRRRVVGGESKQYEQREKTVGKWGDRNGQGMKRRASKKKRKER